MQERVFSFRRGMAALTTIGLSIGALAAIEPAAAAEPAATRSTPRTQNFGCTKGVQSFQVPDEVVRIYVSAWGAAGRGDGAGGGGKGARASGAVPVTPGKFLTVNVGCMGQWSSAGGWNGGGTGGGTGGSGKGSKGQPGGGASDLRTESDLASRLIVGGGGGGKGGPGVEVWDGGAGGAASQAGEAGQTGTSPSNNTPGVGGAGGARDDDSGGRGGDTSGNAASAAGGGGGGGGGWRGGAGGGGARANYIDSGGAGGGGGGGGSSHVTDSATNVSFESGASPNEGILSLSWIDITTTALPNGIYGQAYSAQLAASGPGGTGPFTWELIGGYLAGLTLSPDGTISGSPTTTAADAVTFRVTDAYGAQSVFTTNLVIMPGDTRVTDEPATGIRKRSATGNGTVYGRGLPITRIYCRLATTEAGVDTGTIVNATPGSVGATDTTPVTCPLDGLRPDTRYYYNVIARDAAGNHQATLASQFTTDPLAQQTAHLRGVPQVIKKSGVTTLLKGRTRTNDGKVVNVEVLKLKNRKGKKSRGRFTLNRKRNGQVQIRTFGKDMDLQVIYSAPGDADAAPYEVIHTYRVGRKH